MTVEAKTDSVEDKVADVHAPMTINVDDFKLDSEDKEEEKETKTEEDVEIEVEGKGKTGVETDETEVSKLQKQVSTLTEEILKLSSRKPEKIEPKKEKEEKLSIEQIVGIIEDHKDKPNFATVITNAMKYIAEDVASGVKNKTMEEVSHKQWSSNLSGTANRILSEDNDGYIAANPKLKGELPDMAKNMGLQDHPAGELAAYAIYRLLEGAKAKDKDSKVDKTKESKTTNSSRVMDKTRTSAQTGKVTLTSGHLDAIKKLGADPQLYAMFVKKS